MEVRGQPAPPPHRAEDGPAEDVGVRGSEQETSSVLWCHFQFHSFSLNFSFQQFHTSLVKKFKFTGIISTVISLYFVLFRKTTGTRVLLLLFLTFDPTQAPRSVNKVALIHDFLP